VLENRTRRQKNRGKIPLKYPLNYLACSLLQRCPNVFYVVSINTLQHLPGIANFGRLLFLRFEELTH